MQVFLRKKQVLEVKTTNQKLLVDAKYNQQQ